MKQFILFFLFATGICMPALHAQDDVVIKTYGVKINVTDVAKALKFYRDILGFAVEQGNENGNTILLKPATGNVKIVLQKVSYLLPAGENEAKASLTLQVNNLDSAINNLKAKGIDFKKYPKRKEGVGYSIYIEDPFGTRLAMMHQTVVATAYFNEPKIYNYGLYAPDMDTAKAFFTAKLGFLVLSEKYLPLDLPLGNKDKSFAFMLHTRNNIESIHYNSADNEPIVILFQTNSLSEAIKTLKSRQVKLVSGKIESGAIGNMISFYDPFGYISQIVEVKN